MNPLLRHITDNLSALYERGEARAISLMLLSYLWPEKTDAQLFLIDDDEETYNSAKPFVRRLMSGEPIQYVTGMADFRGLRIHVEPGVLIPRPETELFISILTDKLKGGKIYRLLDIGTGSGCIALALKSEFPECLVEAWDISPAALSVASVNAHRLNLAVEFCEMDILDKSQTEQVSRKYDLIVSNPPYITEAEKNDMKINVLDFEPSLALFVPDSDPLRFYREIARVSMRLLSSGGLLGFEINSRFASELTGMLMEWGFVNVAAHKDQFDKYRFITAVWKS